MGEQVTLPKSPGEVAEVIRERVEALNVALVYADGLNMQVDMDFDVDDETGVTTVTAVDIKQVFNL